MFQFNLFAIIIIFVSLISLIDGSYVPSFKAETIDPYFSKGSYFIANIDFNHDGRLDIVTISQTSDIAVYVNLEPGWEKVLVSDALDETLSAEIVDVDGDKFEDIIITYKFGGSPVHAREGEGAIGWFQNPKGSMTDKWIFREIGRGPVGMHRVRAEIHDCYSWSSWNTIPYRCGFVLGVPIVGPEADVEQQYFNSAAPFIYYRVPKEPQNATLYNWLPMELNHELHTVHDAQLHDILGLGHPQVTTVSNEGFSVMMIPEYDQKPTLAAKAITMNPGISSETFPGSGSQAIGKVKNSKRNFDFVAAIEPFHGDTVAIYSPEPVQGGIHLNRRVLDVRSAGGHDIHTGDFNNDGIPDVVAAFRGPLQKGIILYLSTPTKDSGLRGYRSVDFGIDFDFVPIQVTTDGTSTCRIGDFNNDGLLDIAGIGWGKYDDHSVTIYHHVMDAVETTATIA